MRDPGRRCELVEISPRDDFAGGKRREMDQASGKEGERDGRGRNYLDDEKRCQATGTDLEFYATTPADRKSLARGFDDSRAPPLRVPPSSTKESREGGEEEGARNSRRSARPTIRFDAGS